MSMIQRTAQKILFKYEGISYRELVSKTSKATGKNTKSIRNGMMGIRTLLGGKYVYDNGYFTHKKRGYTGWKIDYSCGPKIKNWKWVKSLLPKRVNTLITLGGEHGNCIECFRPAKTVTYDFDRNVLKRISKKFPNIVSKQGNIFENKDRFHVANIDLNGYMSQSLHENLIEVNDRSPYRYIVLTVQGQRKFRNQGAWVDTMMGRYGKREDPTLAVLQDTLTNYELLGFNFYKRAGKAVKMRSFVWKRV